MRKRRLGLLRRVLVGDGQCRRVLALVLILVGCWHLVVLLLIWAGVLLALKGGGRRGVGRRVVERRMACRKLRARPPRPVRGGGRVCAIARV